MAAVAIPATPQRPLPGAFAVTPAPAPTIFASNAAQLRQNQAPAPTDSGNTSNRTVNEVPSIERAAKTINDTLAAEARFPELESYITQGTSGEYEMSQNPAWWPFQKIKQYDMPSKLLEQANQAGLGIHMGIFAPFGHAWVILDNCLYLWDYTLPNPDLVGWEDNNNPIRIIKLVKPKPGVFIKEIEHVIVVVTTTEMLLLGVAVQTSNTGAKTINLYNTRMSIPVRGISVKAIGASAKTGRIFFSADQSEDLYEFQYQQDEGWFRGRTNRICHTRSNISFMQDNVTAVTQYFASTQPRKSIVQIIVDDSRNLLYTLSSTSEIKVWVIRNELAQVLSRPMGSLLQNTGHFAPRTELLSGRDVSIVSIAAIPATEATRLSLLAITNTGCRLYMSVTRGYGLQADAQNAPGSMQILHIRFPPRDPNAPPSQAVTTTYNNPPSNVDNTSRMLTTTDWADRFPPGYFLDFLASDGANPNGKYKLFCSAPDAARLKDTSDNASPSQKFSEFGMFMELPGSPCDVVPLTAPGDVVATQSPLGYGNELAVQFDKPSLEIAIVTSNAIQTIRRRRVVDVFATMLRYGSNDDSGREGEIVRFSHKYGKAELAATSLAVACGQGRDVTSDSRLTTITDQDVIEGATAAFKNYSGIPQYNPNAPTENNMSAIESVTPSPRHQGMALFISRLIRSMWRTTIIKEEIKPGEGPRLTSSLKLDKLRDIQRDLTSLSEFIDRNKSSIAGFADRQPVGGARSRQEDLVNAGEAQAMRSLFDLISRITEGISFVLVLFEERVEDILAALPEESRRRARELTFEALFVTYAGRELAKELVKAIVNRNIANGSNVDTVAEALRRRCGSFCSADDVVVFKAQELVKRASEVGGQTEKGRVWLNESQRLFQKVAANLTMEYLQGATDQYVRMQFFAGGIQLCLVVAAQRDPAKRALAWLKDGKPTGDERQAAFDKRKECYDLVFLTIEELDTQTGQAPETVDGQFTLAAKRRSEAYDVVNGSEDAVFQTCLFDWYIQHNQADRLLDIDTQYVVEYLQRHAVTNREHADLLWRYHAHHNDYLQAASVQLDLARGFFNLNLEQRIECLSRARTNASTRQSALMDSRQNKQQLLREISDLLDVANIQDDILQRIKSDPRAVGDTRAKLLQDLDGPILPIGELYNQYADQASYHDICILIYQVADHRNPADIRASWQQLIDQSNDQSQALFGREAYPWESVGEKVRELGRRLSVADATFPVQDLLPMLEKYYLLPNDNPPPTTWVLDIFLDLDVPHETLLPVMEQMLYANAEAFKQTKDRRVIGGQMVYLLRSWFEESERKGERTIFGSEENASVVLDCATSLLKEGILDAGLRRETEVLMAAVQRAMR